MSLESAGAARSNAAVNFDRLAGAIERGAGTNRSAQAGAIEGRHVTVGLLGKDKPVKFEMMTNEMVQQFMKMSHEERQSRIGTLQARLQEVKHNPNFSAKGQQANAKIQLAITVPMLVKQLKSEAKVNDLHEAQAHEAKMKEASMKTGFLNQSKTPPKPPLKPSQQNSPTTQPKPQQGPLPSSPQQNTGVPQSKTPPKPPPKPSQQNSPTTQPKPQQGPLPSSPQQNTGVPQAKTPPKPPPKPSQQNSPTTQPKPQQGTLPSSPQQNTGVQQGMLSGRSPALPLGESFHKQWNATMDRIVNSDQDPEQKVTDLKSGLGLMHRNLSRATDRGALTEEQKATLKSDIQRCESEIQKLISGGGKGGVAVERQQAPERPKSKVLSDDEIAAQAYTAATSDPVGFKADAARDKLGNILYSSKPANEKLQLLHAKLEAIDDDIAVIKGFNKDADVKALQDVKQEFTTVIAKLKDEIYQSRKASMSAVVKGDIDFFVKDASTKTSQDMIGILNSANASGFGTNTLMRKYDADDAAIYDQGFTKAYCYLVEHSAEELLQPLTNIMSANNKVAEIRSELINQNLRVFYNNDNTVDPKSGEPLRVASKATENTDFRIVDDYNSSELSADQRQALGSAKEELLKLRNEIMPHVDALDKKDPVAQSFGGYPEININRMLREVRFLLGEISREEYRM